MPRGRRRSERVVVAQRAGLAALRFLSPSSFLLSPRVCTLSRFLSAFILAHARQNKQRKRKEPNSKFFLLFLLFFLFFPRFLLGGKKECNSLPGRSSFLSLRLSSLVSRFQCFSFHAHRMRVASLFVLFITTVAFARPGECN